MLVTVVDRILAEEVDDAGVGVGVAELLVESGAPLILK